MRVFGSECYVYCTDDKKKLDPRSNKGIFVGYDGCSPAYLVYYPDTGKVMKRRVVKFPSAASENTVSLDELLKNPNAHSEPDVTDSGERPDVRDSGAGKDLGQSPIQSAQILTACC